jgi:outer membrane lipoprotein-sorting protein
MWTWTPSAILAFSLSLFATDPPKIQSSEEVKKSSKRPGNVDQVLSQLQKTWDKSAQYQCEFRQSIFSKRLGSAPDWTEGKIFVSKPNKLRWDDTKNLVTQILSGKTVYVIQENRRRKNRTVDVYEDAAKAVDSSSLRFLSGEAKFSEKYTVSWLRETKETFELKFVPKADQTETIIAEIDKSSYLLRALMTDSPDSRVRLEFTNTQQDVHLEDSLFQYVSKPGDVVHKQ